MDITIEQYYHPIYWPHTWHLFLAYNQEIRQKEPMEALKLLPDGLGGVKVGSRLEEWVEGLPGRIKCIRRASENDIIGFMAYEMKEYGLWVEALYILPNFRYNGALRALISSFPGVEKVRFALHKSRRKSPDTDPMLIGTLYGHVIGDYEGHPDLEIWESRLDHFRNFGTNPAMEKLRSIK